MGSWAIAAADGRVARVWKAAARARVHRRVRWSTPHGGLNTQKLTAGARARYVGRTLRKFLA
jgi:hypothetical protein